VYRLGVESHSGHWHLPWMVALSKSLLAVSQWKKDGALEGATLNGNGRVCIDWTNQVLH